METYGAGKHSLYWFKNYIVILQSDSFKYSMQNTLFILVFVIVFTTIIGYLVSVYLNLECKCAGVLLAIAILPWHYHHL